MSILPLCSHEETQDSKIIGFDRSDGKVKVIGCCAFEMLESNRHVRLILESLLKGLIEALPIHSVDDADVSIAGGDSDVPMSEGGETGGGGAKADCVRVCADQEYDAS